MIISSAYKRKELNPLDEIHFKKAILNYPLGNNLINFIHTFRIVLIHFKSSSGKKIKKKIISRGKKKRGGGERGKKEDIEAGY